MTIGLMTLSLEGSDENPIRGFMKDREGEEGEPARANNLF